MAEELNTKQVGGWYFSGRSRSRGRFDQYLSKTAHVPLIVAMDGEWGLGMRLDSTISFPYQMTLGAIQDNQLIYKMGQEVAAQFKTHRCTHELCTRYGCK